MFTDMDQWIEIRRRVLNGELSKRAACAEYGIHWDTLTKILTHSEPPGYRLTKPRTSKLEPFLPVIHEILENDRRVNRKLRHKCKRIFERLREEHDYTGGVTIVKEAVREWKESHSRVHPHPASAGTALTSETQAGRPARFGNRSFQCRCHLGEVQAESAAQFLISTELDGPMVE